MNFSNLKASVAALGFEADVDNEGALLMATRRAIYMLFLERPVESSARIAIPKMPCRLIFDTLEHEGGECEEFKLGGKAISMTLSGVGKYTIIYGNESEVYDFNSPHLRVRKLLRGDAKIRFEGPYSFTVLSLAVYDSIRSPREADIPLYSERGYIKLRSLIPDLLSPAASPTDASGKPIEGAALRGGVLILPKDYHGEIAIRYNRAPILPTDTSPDTELDLPDGSEELLPLLVASYVWLEDEPEISRYYRSLYEDAILNLINTLPNAFTGEYTTDGWA